MELNILDSGSLGNCCILKDSLGNQLMIDCGIKYSRIVPQVDWDRPITCLITHKHKDHSLSRKEIEMSGVDVYCHNTFTNGQLVKSIRGYSVLPIELPHDIDTTSYSFLIYNKAENKTIYFATDCSMLPQIADKKYDLIMLENNYSEEVIQNNIAQGKELINKGYLRHLSVEYVQSWLSKLSQKTSVLVVSHLSNSGNITYDIIKDKLSGLASKLVIANKNKKFTF